MQNNTTYTSLMDFNVFDFKVDTITKAATDVRGLNAYMTISGIKGPNVAAAFENTTSLLAWNHGFTQPAQLGRTGAAGAAVTDPNHGDFTVVKQVDTMTGDLLKKCWDGATIDEIKVQLVRSDGKVFLEIDMTKVIVTDHLILDVPGALDTMERLKFNYSSVKYNYTHYDEQGGALGNDVVSYDRATETVA